MALAQLERGAMLGRYVVLSRLGAGAMGVVFAAYDPELSRKVALKLLQATAPGAAPAEGRRRLLREAQAMARLSHPNVIAVHDVGEHAGQVYLAMQFVDGSTLTEWLRAEPRSQGDVIEVFIAAGRGLAAAHEQGLVHGDFKPDNVMVDGSGRVRVTDFGLARPTKAAALSSTQSAEDPSDPISASLRTGVVVGTPAYMAPEQHLGLELGTAADQFAFCVALWEGLYGERPFGGGSVAELAASVTSGERRPPPKGSSVPAWLRSICERGLSTEPERRFPSMQALLDRVQRGQRSARRRKYVLGGVLVAGAGVVALGYGRYDHARSVSACESAGAKIAEVWNPERGSRVRRGLLDTGTTYAATTADHVMPWLDEHANRWAKARTEVCLNETVRGTWEAETVDQGLWCLDERRLELDALAATLERPDDRAVQNAVRAAAQLSAIDGCVDVHRLSRVPPPPEADREGVRAVRADLSRATAKQLTSNYEDGLAVARKALSDAEAIGWAPLEVAIRYQIGALLFSSGQFALAEAELEAAYFEAFEIGAMDVARLAAEELVLVVGDGLQRHTDALRWSRQAQATGVSLPDPAGVNRAENLEHRSIVKSAAGAYDEARALNEEALDLRLRSHGADHPEVAMSLNNLGNVLRLQGEHEKAREMLQRVTRIWRETLGPGHPRVARSLNNLAVAHESAGALREAASAYRESLSVFRSALGDEHPHVAQTLSNLANVHLAMGEPAEAKELQLQALAILEPALGPEHVHVGQVLVNLAAVHVETGAYDEALSTSTRALAIFDARLNPEHPLIASSLVTIARVHAYARRYPEAKKALTRALRIHEAALGSDHPDFAKNLAELGSVHVSMHSYAEARVFFERALSIYASSIDGEHHSLMTPLVGLAEVALAQDKPAEAVAHARRAADIAEASVASGPQLAWTRFVLARALAEAAEDPDRAMRLAKQALDAYLDAGEPFAEERSRVERWIARHGS